MLRTVVSKHKTDITKRISLVFSESELFEYFFIGLTRAVLGGAFFRPPPPQVFRRYLKNGGAQRRRFWHTLSYIFSA